MYKPWMLAFGLALGGSGAIHPSAADAPAAPAALDPTAAGLLRRSFVYGREYFVLRSGPAKMIVQSDRLDAGPAFLYLLFDAEDGRQSARKERAWNFADGHGFLRSGLEVMLGGFPYTAVGHMTETRWTDAAGIPTVEACWWAGGVQVTERIHALVGAGVFVRTVELHSVNLGGAESVSARLALPTAPARAVGGRLVQETGQRSIAVWPEAGTPHSMAAEAGRLELGPFELEPGQRASFTTYVHVGAVAELPAGFDAAAASTATRAWWARASRVTTTDPVVQEIYEKATRGLPGMVADNGVMDAGIFEYGAQWVRDTSNTLLGLIHAGQFELARAGFEHLLEGMVRDDGATMIANAFDDPDREQFDQMGELIHALKAYRDWTGDVSLLERHRAKLVAMVERPLRPEFRDETGMVHNRREFWERTFDDAYELAYQTYVVLGLRDAAALAEALGVPDRRERWLREADRTLEAVLRHPTRALVADGHLIKRRGTDGQRVRQIRFPPAAADVPLKTERVNLAEPDATMALPIAFRLIEPTSGLARGTLDELERLWNGRWFGGGYERYHSSGQCDQPGPWTFATTFILRGQHEARLFDRSRRSLEWLNQHAGGRTGSWFEEIPLVRSQAPTAGILPWTSGEVSLFVIRHLLGVRFEGEQLVLEPALYPGSGPLRADLRFRQGRLELEVPGAGRVEKARVNGAMVRADPPGVIRLPREFAGGSVRFVPGPSLPNEGR